MKKKIAATRGPTTVFADLGYANPEEMLAKAQLVSRISDLIKQRRLTQGDAATLLGIDQPNVSRLLRGQLSGFSYERLLKFLNALGCDIEIVVKRSGRARRHAQVTVKAA
jgi:predicted XRE-type DNA-binding protein